MTQIAQNGEPQPAECQKCHGRGYIVVDHPTHTDLVPCQCIGAVNQCAKGHAAILFQGAACPLCAVLSESKEAAMP